MANIELKTLKFPGLEDTYVLPEVSINDPNNDGNVELLFTIPISLFTFHIASATGSYGDGTTGTYQALPGMTLIEWVQSEYNTSDNIWYSESMGDIYPYIYLNSDLNETYDGVIEDGYTYYVE